MIKYIHRSSAGERFSSIIITGPASLFFAIVVALVEVMSMATMPLGSHLGGWDWYRNNIVTALASMVPTCLVIKAVDHPRAVMVWTKSRPVVNPFLPINSNLSRIPFGRDVNGN